MMPFFLGIDGGGTKTRCLVGDEESELGRGSSSSCKVQKVGEAGARDSLSAAIHEACVQAGISPRKISRTCAGITGSGRAEIGELMRDLVISVVGGEVEVIGDIDVAFEDAFADQPGVLVIAGTGAIAYGKNSAGNIARVGGWGYLVSDEGSGSWVGLEAVRAVLREKDRGENPALLGRLTEAFGTANFDQFVIKLNGNPVPDFSTLFPVVLSSAEDDAIARAVLERAGRELAINAGTLVERLFMHDVCSVISYGGVFSSSEIVMAEFSSALKTRSPNATLLTRTVDPARGALERARRGFRPASAT